MSITDELQARMDEMAAHYTAGDAKAVAELFMADGALYSPFAPPAIGRTAIEELHKDWVSESDEQKSFVIIDAGRDGSLAWCLAEFSEGNGAVEGTTLAVFTKAAKEPWRIKLCSLNAA